MPFDLKDLEVTRNCLERLQSPRIGQFVGETSAPLRRHRNWPPSLFALAFLNELQYRYANGHINSDDDAAILRVKIWWTSDQ